MKRSWIWFALLALVLSVAVAYAFQSTNITTATTTTVFARAGYLSHVKVNGGTMGSFSVWDNNATTGVLIDTVASPLAGQHYVYDRDLIYGLKVVTAAATNLTVFHR